MGFKIYDKPYKKKNGDFLWLIFLIILVLIVGLRYKVGGDSYNYITFFIWSSELANWKLFNALEFEPGFSLLTSAIRTLTDNIYVYQTIISFLQAYMIFMFIKLNTTYKFLALLLIYINVFIFFYKSSKRVIVHRWFIDCISFIRKDIFHIMLYVFF